MTGLGARLRLDPSHPDLSSCNRAAIDSVYRVSSGRLASAALAGGFESCTPSASFSKSA